MKLSIDINSNELSAHELSEINAGFAVGRTKDDLADAGDFGGGTEQASGDVTMGEATPLDDPDFGVTSSGRRSRRGLGRAQIG